MVLLAPFSGVDPTVKAATQVADAVKRRRLPLSEFLSGDEKLAQAYAYWQSKRQGGTLPSRRNIDVLDLRTLMGWMHLVEVGGREPSDYTYRLLGSSVRMNHAPNANSFRLGDYAPGPYRDALFEDYSSVCFTGVPSYQQVVAMMSYIKYSYSRLILPLAEDGRKVDMLMVCINKREFDDFTL
jgi:PAS domain